jgi:hypothetical protein
MKYEQLRNSTRRYILLCAKEFKKLLSVLLVISGIVCRLAGAGTTQCHSFVSTLKCRICPIYFSWTFRVTVSGSWNQCSFSQSVLRLSSLSVPHVHKIEAWRLSHIDVKFPRMHIQRDTRTCILQGFLWNLSCICRNGSSRRRKGNTRDPDIDEPWY